MTANVKGVVEDWFRAYGGGGLMLPDGWFGRPHDNVHQLTFIAVRPSWLILELDERLLVTIRDPKKVVREGRDLVVGEFSSCGFDWKEYGSERGHRSWYDGGEVRLVPPPGA